MSDGESQKTSPSDSVAEGTSSLIGNDGAIHFPTESAVLPVYSDSSHVTAVGITCRGNRMLTGNSHGVIRIWDFLNMDYSATRFRELTLPEGHAIRTLSFSISGSHILCTSNDRYVHLLDNSLVPLVQTFRGDMYVRDSAQTTGHTHTVYGAAWDPTEIRRFASGSLDGTVRIWDIDARREGLDQALPNLIVLKTVDRRGSSISKTCGVHSVCYVGSNLIAGGCADDSIQLWDNRTGGVKSRKPKILFRSHHEGEPVERLCSNSAGSSLFSRSANHLHRTINASSDLYVYNFLGFDLRQSQAPTHSLKLPTGLKSIPHLELIDFGRYLITSTVSQAQGQHIPVLDTRSLEHVESLNPGVEQMVSLTYHESLKQIFCGSSKGSVGCLYSSQVSSTEGGRIVKDSGGVDESAKAEGDHPTSHPAAATTSASTTSYSWYNLPPNIKCLSDGTLKEVKPKRHELRSETNPAVPLSLRLPHEEPILKKTMAQSVMKAFLDAEAEHRGSQEDWVERLRAGTSAGAQKYGSVSLVDRAYKRTQPEPILDTSPTRAGGEALLAGEKKCPQCGLKLCTCGYLTLVRGRMETQKVKKLHRASRD